MLGRFVRPASIAVRRQPLAWSVQQRNSASHQDATCPQSPYGKAEKVGQKRFCQFDLDGKVFVVTGEMSTSFWTV